MPKTKVRRKQPSASKPPRAKLTPEESLKRMQSFSKRKDQFVATVRKRKDRSLSA